MTDSSTLQFGPYRLAGPQGPLFMGSRRLQVKPKALAVLWELVRQAGEVVTKTALIDTLWPRAVVGDDAIAFQIQALRRVLEDDARQPRYIATCHRIGYMFVAPVTTGAAAAGATLEEQASSSPAMGDAHVDGSLVVGRDVQLAQLQRHYAKALRGERQLVLVSGEAGIGKTSLVQRFVARLNEAPLIGHGQCVEQHGAGEGYLPVLEALGAICRQPRGARVIEVLRQAAPTWLMQLPALLSQDDLAALQQRVAGAAPERMLREIADALQSLTSEVPLILVLEDLHWSDPSTIEMLSLLARRTDPARLLVLATYRQTDVIATNHPLKAMKQELVARGLATEIVLENLPPADVQSYLSQRFPDAGDDGRLSAFVYRRTEGHPLFMVQVADYLALDGASERIGSSEEEALEAVVPQGLRELIEVQFERLTDDERRVLEMASVAGAEFAVAGVGAAARMPIEDVETCCERLARHGQFIEDRGLAPWPGEAVCGRYGFRHALYQDVLYARLSPRQRAQAHLAIGLCEEAGYGERSAEIADELAVHFERGRDLARAVRYRQQAGERALQRSANTEAVVHFTKALDLLAAAPATAERVQHELRLQMSLSLGLTMTKGYSVPEVERVNARAFELCQQVGETPEISSALFRIERFHLVRGEIRRARELGEQLLRIAQRAESPALLSQAHTALSFESFSFGDFSAAREHATQSIGYDDLQRYKSSAIVSGDDSSAVSYSIRAWALQISGYPEQAQRDLQKATELVKEIGTPFTAGGALLTTTDFNFQRRDGAAVLASAEATIALGLREGFPYYVGRATTLRGWALAEQGQTDAGIADIQQGLAMFQASGAKLWSPCCLGLLAEAYGWAGKIEQGLRVLSEALEIADSSGERQYEAELHRLKGELTLKASWANWAAAEECFDRAITVARRQEAKCYELRASLSLARLWHRQGTRGAAHSMLAEIADWFTEGLDAKDLLEARELISESAAGRAA